jgi:hypothetical protein
MIPVCIAASHAEDFKNFFRVAHWPLIAGFSGGEE